MELSEISKNVLRYPVLLVCGILAPIFLLVVVMRSSKTDAFEQEIGTLERQWRQMQVNIERSFNLETDVQAIAHGAGEIQQRLMRETAIAANSEFFYRIEAESGASLQNFNIGNAGDGNNMAAGIGRLQHFQVLPFTMVVQGEFAQILRFIDLLKAQAYVVHVDTLVLSRPQGARDAQQLSASLRCYVLAEKKS